MTKSLFDNSANQEIILFGCLYIICTRLSHQEQEYIITVREDLSNNSDEIWVKSLYEMSYYHDFGPNFSTLNIIVSHSIWNKYDKLSKDEKRLAAKIVLEVQGV